MTFEEKIYTILKLNKLEINTVEDLSEKAGFSRDTIRKAIARGSELNPGNTRTFVDRLGINWDWWDHQKGEVFNEKHTSVQRPTDNKIKSLKDALEAAVDKVSTNEDEYYIVPKTVFEGKYRFIPIEELEMNAKELERKNDELVRKDHQIQGLHELFKLIISGRRIDVPNIQEGEEKASI